VVVIPAGVPRKPGMTRDDLFNTNASIVANLCKVSFGGNDFEKKDKILPLDEPTNLSST
jgi:hypothetical protein